MKKLLLFLCALIIAINLANAQFEYGIRMGVSTQGLNTDEILLESNTFHDLRVSLGEAAYGYHVGLYTQLRAFGLTISPELIFNSNSYEYKIIDGSLGEGVTKLIKDQYQYIDLPVLVGLKLGFLRAYLGPEVHYFINNYSKLLEHEGFQEQINKINYGAIAGAGVNLGKLRLDVRYEINFDDFESHIFYDNHQLNFNSDDSRIIFTAAWKFN